MVNNLGAVFKTYITIVSHQIQKNKQLEDNKVLFKAIKKKKIHIKDEYKAPANFVTTK